MSKKTIMRVPRLFLVLLAFGALIGAVALGARVVQAHADAGADTGASAQAGGELPDGASPFDDLPGIMNLDPALLAAVRDAANAAERDGVEVIINSGWRSRDLQERLIDDAIAEHGNWEEASRWVATAHGSSHVTGDAVDIGGYDAAAWFQLNGARYDLCQVFENEAWHFELRPGAASRGCPSMYRDARDDPRNADS